MRSSDTYWVTCFTLINVSRPYSPSSRPKPEFCSTPAELSTCATCTGRQGYQQQQRGAVSKLQPGHNGTAVLSRSREHLHAAPGSLNEGGLRAVDPHNARLQCVGHPLAHLTQQAAACCSLQAPGCGRSAADCASKPAGLCAACLGRAAGRAECSAVPSSEVA